jgi:transposase
MSKRLRLEDSGNQGQLGRPQPGTEVKIAVDLSRSKWVYCVRWEGAERLRLSTGSELKHVQALVRRYEGCPVHLTYEACGFGYQIAWWAREEKMAVTVIAPSRMERPPGLQVKTDRLDVARMARQLEEGTLRGIYIPARAEHERRQVVRTYGQAIKERKREQVRIRSMMQEHGRIGPAPRAGWKAYGEWLGTQELPEDVKLCVETLLAMRTLAEQRAKVLEQRLHAMARSEEYRQIVTALCTQRGVGVLSAIRFILEIGDVRRFPTADSIGHYLGLTPSEYSSGDTVHRGHILKCGPGTVRAAMLQCGWASVRKGGDPTLRAVYDRLVPRAGNKRAIIAVTRRLVVRLRARWLETLDEGGAAAA